ncbi:Putative ankyrin repeat-containing domain superfamily [Colletotrichum destructivum]|uniref:Ankyrin repeat-containing domain superfamily n=1 Tax=Colletotrichum destructivum TaxID=34406 RepID=A0AAX4IRQ4_9PEZI|nr:Putative ankyrin repeat-containing domain superfamily [Colletotrichum destructivum]
MEAGGRGLRQALTETQAKTQTAYLSMRDPGSHNELRLALRLISGTLHSLLLLFDDFADGEHNTASTRPDHTLIDSLGDMLDDLTQAWSSDFVAPGRGTEILSPPEFASQIRQFHAQLSPAIHANSWATLLVFLSTTGPRKPSRKRETDELNDLTCEASETSPEKCLNLLLSPEFDRKLDSCYSHRVYAAERDATHPEYVVCAKLLPKIAHSYHCSIENELRLLFHPRKSANFLQWLLEYARQEWPGHFKPASGALSMSPLRRLMTAASDASVSTLHIASALGLHHVCKALIHLEKQDVNQQSLMGTPLYCALLGPTALFARYDDPAQLVADRRPTSGQEPTLHVLLDAGATGTSVWAGSQQDKVLSLATVAFFTCQSIDAPDALVRILRAGFSRDDRFLQLFHGKNSILQYWPSPLPPLTRSFLASVLPEILDSAAMQYNGDDETSLLMAGIYDILEHHGLADSCSGRGSRPLSVSDKVYADLVQEAVQDHKAAVVRRLILDPRWNPNQSIPSCLDSEEPFQKSSTILHDAVESCDADTASLILQSGDDVDVHVRDECQRTPLMLSETPDVLRLLLSHGARTTDTDEDGRNVWHIAAANSDIGMIDALHAFDEHTDWNLRALMKNGQTPIAQSIIYPLSRTKRLGISKRKAAAGALHMLEVCEPNAAYLQSPTPLLFLAVEWGSCELVRKLIDFGADPFEMGDDGRNALHYLEVNAGEDLVETLLDLHVEPVLTKDGQSPAETIFTAFNESLFWDPDPDRPIRRPVNHRPLDFGAYNRLFTDEVLGSRNSEGSGLWERFATGVLGTWASKWPPGSNVWESLQTAVDCLVEKAIPVRYEEETGKCALVPILSAWMDYATTHDKWPVRLGEMLCSILRVSTKVESFQQSPAAVQCLKLAVEQEHRDVVVMLLDLGVSVHARHESVSALESACLPESTCPPAIFDKLLEHADPSKLNDVDGFRSHFLFRLLDDGVSHRTHKLSALVDKGCDPNVLTPAGAPMVMAYIKNRETNAAIILLEKGANPALSLPSGLDAALAAASRGDLIVLEKIRSISSTDGHPWGKCCTYDFSRVVGPKVVPEMARQWRCNALHLAAAHGHADVLQFYLGFPDLDVESQTADGWRPLHFAAACAVDDGSCVRLLLEHGADPTATLPFPMNQNPLSLASLSGATEAVQLLLDVGPKNFSRMNIPAAFVEAFRSGEPNLMEQFLPLMHKVIMASAGNTGQTSVLGAVLELCIQNGYEQLAAQAMTMVRPEIMNSIRMRCGRCSPLVLAAAQGRFTLGEIFLDHGMTAWNLVDRCSHLSVISQRLHYPCTALHIALMRPSHLPSTGTEERFVRRLLGVMDWTRHELSPFHYAAASGVPDRVRMVVDWIKRSPEHHPRLLHGVQPFSANEDAESGDQDPSWEFSGKGAVDAIIKHHVNKRVASPDLQPMFRLGMTPLLVAAEETNIEGIPSFEMMEVLLDHGAEVNVSDLENSDTPLHGAAMVNRIDSARRLLEHGADPNLCNLNSFTPLTVAVRRGHLEMAQLLVERGADVHARDIDGMSLLNACADASDHPEMFIWLMSLGLDPCKPDGTGYTPLHKVILNNAFPGLVFNHGLDFSRVRDVRKGFLSLVIKSHHRRADGTLRRLFKRLPRENALELANSTPGAFFSPLCVAVVRNRLDCVSTLLRHGADIDAEGSAEGSALMVACTRHKLKAVKLLVRSGASISYQAMVDGVPVFRSALESARPYPRVVRWLLVDRHARLRSIESVSEDVGEAEVKPWSGGRVAGYELSGVGINTGRRVGETGLEYLRRLDRIRWSLRGQTIQVVALR